MEIDEKKMDEIRNLVLFIVRAKDKLPSLPPPEREKHLASITEAQNKLRAIQKEMGLWLIDRC